MHLTVGVPDSALRAEVVNRLRSKGIPYVTLVEAMKLPGRPDLYVVEREEPPKGSNVFRVEVSLNEQAVLARNTAISANATTWSVDTVVLGGRDSRAARNALIGAVDRFIGAYLDANPRR